MFVLIFLRKKFTLQSLGFKLDHPQWWKRRGRGETVISSFVWKYSDEFVLAQPELLGWHRSNPWENPENSVKNGRFLFLFFCFFCFFCEHLCVAKAFFILNRANLHYSWLTEKALSCVARDIFAFLVRQKLKSHLKINIVLTYKLKRKTQEMY